MYQVYVLAKNGKPLMPTKRFGKVRRMLRCIMRFLCKIGCHKFDRRKILIEEELTKPTVLIIPPKFNKFSIKKVSEIKQELRQVETTLSNIHKEGELPAT